MSSSELLYNEISVIGINSIISDYWSMFFVRQISNSCYLVYCLFSGNCLAANI